MSIMYDDPRGLSFLFTKCGAEIGGKMEGFGEERKFQRNPIFRIPFPPAEKPNVEYP